VARSNPRSRRPSRPVRRLPPEALLILLLAVSQLGIGVTGTSFRTGFLEGAALLGLYLGLATFLVLGAVFAHGLGRVPGALSALALAAVPALQLRSDAQHLVQPVVWLAFVLVVGALVHFVLWKRAPRGRRVSVGALAGSLGALAVLVLGVGLAARQPALHWHLLNHHRLLGTPLYELGSRRLDVERDLLWTRRGRLSSPGERAAIAPPAPVPFGRPPHVVFVLVDTLRADALAAWGGDETVMPRMNALARESLVLSDLHTNASWTRASCGSIFTGLLPEEHGAARFHEALAEQWHTLPERLQEAGYQTAAFVSNWVQVGRATGFAQGFDTFEELNPAGDILARKGGQDEVAVRGGYARAAEVNAATFAWLDGPERDAYRPLFLYLHYLDPHSPYLEPPEPGALHEPRERKRGLYRQELRALDKKLDELVRGLEERLGPVVLILTSDHGEEFWEHDDWGHGHTLYRELVWVPCFVRRPGAPAGVSDAPLESRDLYALVLDLAADANLDLGTWTREHARTTRYASQYLDRVDDVRDDRKWTGMRRVDEGAATLIWSAFGPTEELYDRAEDPGELDNRIGREADRAGPLRGALERAVRFWTRPVDVERTAEDLRFLQELGYAGGAEAPAKTSGPASQP
jgi:arylsulfatase A-like enzyme